MSEVVEQSADEQANGSAFRRALEGVLTFGAQRLSQNELAALLGMSSTTLSRAKTRSGGLLVSERERGSDIMRFGPDMGLVLSIAIGAESLRAGLVDANGEVFGWWAGAPRHGQRSLTPQELAPRIREAAVGALAEALKDPKLVGDNDKRPRPLRLLGAVACWPSAVNRVNELKGRAFNEAWQAIDVRRWLADILGGPFAEAADPDQPRSNALNSANAAALAVAFHKIREDPPEPDRVRERRTLLVMRVSGGVGLGTIELPRECFPGQDPLVSPFVRARLMVGMQGAAGEIGHLPIDSSELLDKRYKEPTEKGLRPLDVEATCSCGRQLRHLEALAGSRAFTERLTENGSAAHPSVTDAVEHLLRPGPDDARPTRVNQALRDAGRLLGLGLTGPILVLNPMYITFVGALADDSLLEGVQEMRTEWRNTIDTGADIVLRALDRHHGMRSGVRGAGLAILRGRVHRRLHLLAADFSKPATFDFGPKQLAALASSA